MIRILGFIVLRLILNGCATSSGGYSGSGLIGNNRNTNCNLSDARLAAAQAAIKNLSYK